MWPEQFNWLLDRVQDKLQKRSRRTPLDPKLRLQVTLLYLAQRDSILSKHTEFRIGKSTAYAIIPETCQAIWEALQPIFLQLMDQSSWKKVSDVFFDKWQFPNCLGAIDGVYVLKLLLGQDQNSLITKDSSALCSWVFVMQNINSPGWILNNMDR